MSKVSEKNMLRCENCGQSPLMLLEKFEYEDVHCLSEDGRYIRDPILEPNAEKDVALDENGNLTETGSMGYPRRVERHMWLFCHCCGEKYMPLFETVMDNGPHTRIRKGKKVQDGIHEK